MKRKAHCATALFGLVLAGPVLAQHDQHTQHAGHSAYADQEPSGISSLSQQEMSDLLAGAGMGLARPAELNQYPGPKHVLELAEELELSAAQRASVEAIRLEMLEKAKALGEEIVDKERHLDKRFAHRHIDEETLLAVIAEIAELHGELRFAHLRAHLGTREVLSPEQIESYDRLRGY